MVCSWGNRRNRERSGHTDVRPRCSYTWTSAKRPSVKIHHVQPVATAQPLPLPRPEATLGYAKLIASWSKCPTPRLPALSADGIAVDVGRGHAGTRAVADLAADHRVAAKCQRLALGALGLQGPGGADTVAGHRLAQPRSAVTGWTGDGRGLERVAVVTDGGRTGESHSRLQLGKPQ